MREALELFRHERRARAFFLALAQSSLCTGAAYVALLVIAERRFGSAWAISAILVADLAPSALLGPVFGAVADRFPRRACVVLADVLRAGAFAGIALVGSFEATVAFALLAGVGNALFVPSALAALPSVVDEPERRPAATALYGAVGDLGWTAGPALAAVVLLVAGPQGILAANAISFALCAAVLATLRFGAAPEREPAERAPTLLAETREGLRVVRHLRGLRVVLLGTSAMLFCGGLFNVAELFFATEDLGTTESGYGALVTVFGIGFFAGSLSGSSGGGTAELKSRYLVGLAVMGGGFLLCGLTGAFPLALATFAVAGFGNGALLVYQRLLVQASVEDSMLGRMFGVDDALTAWAFAAAFLGAGGLVELLGARELIQVAGLGGLVICGISALALRGDWSATVAAADPSAVLRGTRPPQPS